MWSCGRPSIYSITTRKTEEYILKNGLSLYNKSTLARHTKGNLFPPPFVVPPSNRKMRKALTGLSIVPGTFHTLNNGLSDGPTSSSSTQMGKHTHNFRVSEQKRRATQWIKRFYSSTSTCVDAHKLCHPHM